MNILIIASEFPPGPGGIGQHAYLLAKAMHDKGCNVGVLSQADYASEEETAKFDQNQAFCIQRYPRSAGFGTYLSRLRITFAVLKQKAVTNVILTGKFSLWQGLLINLFYPHIIKLAVLHGSEVNLSNRVLRWLTHRAIATADVIIPVSHFTRSLLPAWIVKGHERIQVIPNGIEQTTARVNTSDSIELTGTPRLLTVGHVSPRKGQHRVIKAMPLLLQEWPELHYHIVGRPKNQVALELLAVRLGVMNHITFHGSVP